MHPTRDTPALIFLKPVGGRVMPGVRRLRHQMIADTVDARKEVTRCNSDYFIEEKVVSENKSDKIESNLPNRQSLWSLPETVERLAKVILPILSLIYILGYLVVSSYLAKYSISSMDLVRAQYILAGVWLLLPLALTYLSFAWGLSIILNPEESSESYQGAFDSIMEGLSRFFDAIAFLILISIFLYLMVSPFFKDIMEFWGALWNLIIPILVIIMFSVLIVVFGGIIWLDKSDRSSSGKWWSAYRKQFIWGSLCVLTFFAYVGFFITDVYPRIPNVLGGGRPLVVRFLLKEHDCVQPNKGFLIRGSPCDHSISYRLVLATDKTYVVLPVDSTGKAVEFSKEIVEGVILSDTR